MNEWLASDGTTDHEGLDLESFLTRILGHETVTFSHEGRQYVKTNEEITAMVHSALCTNCNKMRAELYLLRTDEKIQPDARSLIRQYIDDSYTTARSRQYSRRQLYDELSVFLKPFGLYLTKELERFIIHDVLKDDSRQYRKLRIQRT
jgi:hypothetical protein